MMEPNWTQIKEFLNIEEQTRPEKNVNLSDEGFKFDEVSFSYSTLIYAQCVSRIGSYFAKAYNLERGSSIAYLIAPAMHGAVGIDEALTQANVDVVCFWSRPTESNMSGAILTGRQAQCETVVSAFKEVIFDLVSEPIEY